MRLRPRVDQRTVPEPRLASLARPTVRIASPPRARARLGCQRGDTVAAITVARTLAEGIWSMLVRDEPLAPALRSLTPDGPRSNCATGARSRETHHPRGAIENEQRSTAKRERTRSAIETTRSKVGLLDARPFFMGDGVPVRVRASASAE